ncbi:MAG: peptide chain release factor N(5)-glutamine methyltransferase, partial [Candidatus Omnitrophica bacterium]|nr:peptide chain release factor N(5)-glutamine methyltransferase [Candidatus Omnitrophota bacterium]
ADFMGLELAVNPSVLVPRPETEQLVDHAVKHLHKTFPAGSREVIHVLDLGCGSGNIAVALAKFISNAQVVTIDTSDQALEVARANAKRHGLEKQIQFIKDDYPVSFAAIPQNPWYAENKKGLFDLVIANPPYIPTALLKDLPKDVQQEPAAALDGGKDGLKFIRVIIKYSPYLLRNGACLMMEFGDDQAQAVRQLALDLGTFSNIEIFKDLAGRDRILKATL